MKKAILFLVALILLSVATNAQSSGKCYTDNTRLLNVGLGLSRNYYNYSGFTSSGVTYRNWPTLCLSYEQTYPKRLGPGFLGIGAFLSYQSTLYRSEWTDFFGKGYYYQDRYMNYVVAARATYHWDGLIADNAEVYGGAIAGLRIQTYNYSTNDISIYKDTYRKSNTGAVQPVITVFAGARWYFVPKIALYGELSGGIGIPFVSGGFTFKL
jgi:hypothetical protein